MAPGETREWRLAFAGYFRANAYPPDVLFRDVGGRYWIRHYDGRLEEVDEHAVFSPDPAVFDTAEEHPYLLAKSPEEEHGRTV